jgi:hypothetical protein
MMRSVPPRGSGWVVPAWSLDLRTHPLPRGGTDFMTRDKILVEERHCNDLDKNDFSF